MLYMTTTADPGFIPQVRFTGQHIGHTVCTVKAAAVHDQQRVGSSLPHGGCPAATVRRLGVGALASSSCRLPAHLTRWCVVRFAVAVVLCVTNCRLEHKLL